jgi:hypothetical protein
MQQRIRRKYRSELPDQFRLGDLRLQRFGRKQFGFAHAPSA